MAFVERLGDADVLAFALCASLVGNLLLALAFAYHRRTLQNYRLALTQWMRWGTQMRRNLGWSDSYLRTRVRDSEDMRKTRVRPKDG